MRFKSKVTRGFSFSRGFADLLRLKKNLWEPGYFISQVRKNLFAIDLYERLQWNTILAKLSWPAIPSKLQRNFGIFKQFTAFVWEAR